MTIFTKKSPPSGFYVYLYLRESDSVNELDRREGTPYYVGKGLNDRAWKNHGKRIKVPGDHYIQIIAYNLTDQQAKDLEKELIAKYGRIDLGTGILMNLTEGGEGVYGTSEEVRAKRRESQRKTWSTPEARSKKSEATKKVWADPEYKEKRAANIKKAWADPELRAKHSAKIKKTWSDPKLRKEQSDIIHQLFQNPEVKSKHCDKMQIINNNLDKRLKASKTMIDHFQNNPDAREKASKASKEKWKKVTPERWEEIIAKRKETIKRKKEQSKNN